MPCKSPSAPPPAGWSAFGRIQLNQGQLPSLRNPRAFACAHVGEFDRLRVFFVADNDRLFALSGLLKHDDTVAWAETAEQPNPKFIVHPFSALAVAGRGGVYVHAFCLGHVGRLTEISWGFWGGRKWRVQRLETSRELLLGGALAAVSPSYDRMLVFGINRSLQLAMKSWGDSGWDSLKTLGKKEDKVFAHSRLAVHAVSKDEIEVAAMTDRGNPCVYRLTWDATAQAWTAAARTVIKLPTQAVAAESPPAPTAKIQPAKDCRINPYTDLAIVREPGQTQSTLFCAGLLKAKHALLRCRLGAGPGWELIA